MNGDLVFFNTNGKDVSFVGTSYLGNSQFICSDSKKRSFQRISVVKNAF
ncbi:hypothetical protein D0469_16920 [Peribacillus saganii]|uniref:NlpC/P60 domain-containing protein n=1 Tax=Peribacillus saganii TaxID=2303992 RepID=A0A372LIT2_9BACI|nr:hypothetical protein D0469_16920 [Peribacillus saganii]